MSCILRVSGSTLDVDALLIHPSLSIQRYWRKGQTYVIDPKRHHTDSGIQVVASDAEITELTLQVAQATNFLRENGAAIAVLTRTPGVESAELYFGVALLEGNVAVMFEAPRELVRLAATAGLGINVSTYLTSADDEAEA